MTELKLKPTTYSISSEFIQNNLDTSKSPSNIGSEAALGWPFLFSQVLRSTPHWWCIFLVTFPTLSRVISKILWGSNFDYDKGIGLWQFSTIAQCSLLIDYHHYCMRAEHHNFQLAKSPLYIVVKAWLPERTLDARLSAADRFQLFCREGQDLIWVQCWCSSWWWLWLGWW